MTPAEAERAVVAAAERFHEACWHDSMRDVTHPTWVQLASAVRQLRSLREPRYVVRREPEGWVIHDRQHAYRRIWINCFEYAEDATRIARLLNQSEEQ